VVGELPVDAVGVEVRRLRLRLPPQLGAKLRSYRSFRDLRLFSVKQAIDKHRKTLKSRNGHVRFATASAGSRSMLTSHWRQSGAFISRIKISGDDDVMRSARGARSARIDRYGNKPLKRIATTARPVDRHRCWP
jgi:hypothetical protein